jgi:SAM-dependent methyltransferase
MVYARLLPPPDFLSCVYDKVIRYEDCVEGSENAESYARRMRYLATLLVLAKQERHLKALDFGCGLGVTLRVLSAVVRDTVGFDPSPARRGALAASGCTVVSNENELRKHGPFDILICDNVLEHIAQPHDALDLLASLSRPTTCLYVSVPAYEKPMIREQLRTLTGGGAVSMTLNPWEHLNYFTLKHLDDLLSSHGFLPYNASALPAQVNVGLRPEKDFARRLKNCLATTLRLATYSLTGRVRDNVNDRFYRFEGAHSQHLATSPSMAIL